jgi:hypothetical protein
VKEPHYYVYLAEPTLKSRTYPDDAAATRRYRALYEGVGAETIVCDASTTTMVVPGTAPIIARDAPGSRIVAVLRHPVDRAFSSWSQLMSVGAEQLGFEEAVRTESARRAAGKPFNYQYLDWGHYARQLRPFFDTFGPDRVLVHLYEDLVSDGVAVLRSTFRFLGVDDTLPVPPLERENETRYLRFREVGGRPGRLVRRVTPERWRYRPKPVIDPALRDRLMREEFAEEIGDLEDLLQRDLSAWRSPSPAGRRRQ